MTITERFEIKINLNSYIWKNGKIDRFGDIHIKLNDYSFPSKDWNDFGSDIIYWWMEAFLKLLNKEEEIVQCAFMDGNYRFDVSLVNSQMWKISCIKENSDSERVRHESNINSHQTIEAVVNAAKQFQNLIERSTENESINNFNNRIIEISKFL